MKKDYKDFILSLFDKNGKALLGSEIAEQLRGRFRLSAENARKTIGAAVKEGFLFSSKPLKFQHGQYGYATIKNRSVFGQLINARSGLRGAYGLLSKTLVPENELMKLAQATYTNMPDSEALQKLIYDLGSIEPIEKKVFLGCPLYGTQSRVRRSNDDECQRIVSNVTKEAKICQLVYSYCKDMNLISSAIYRSTDEPWKLVGDYVGFDMLGYSNLGASNRQMIFVFDTAVAWNLSEERAKRFVKRIKIFNARRSNGPNKYLAKTIGAFVVRDLNHSLRTIVDPQGKMLWIGLRQLFGKRIDPFLWVIGQDLKAIKGKETDDGFFDKLTELAEGDFGSLLARFIDDLFEIIVNACLSEIVGKPFAGRAVSDSGGNKKEFDGFFEDEDAVWVVESKNKGKRKIEWLSQDSKGQIENDCLQYFFDEKISFLRTVYPGKKIYACYVARSGYSKREESEGKISRCERFPGIQSYLLTPKDLLAHPESRKSSKPFLCLDKFFIKDEQEAK